MFFRLEHKLSCQYELFLGTHPLPPLESPGDLMIVLFETKHNNLLYDLYISIYTKYNIIPLMHIDQ